MALAGYSGPAPRALPEGHFAAVKADGRKLIASRSTAKRSVAAARAGLSRPQLWLVIGVALLSVPLLVRWRSARRATPVEPSFTSGQAGKTNLLEALLSNSLPIVEEALPLPQSSVIFGCPRLESPFRIDTAHALSGPHYPVEAPEPSRPPATSDAAAQPMMMGAARKVRVDQAHPRRASGALDRALAAFEKGPP